MRDEDEEDYSWVPEAQSTNPVEVAREVVEHGVRRADGILIDAQSARMLVKVYEALNPENQAKLERLPIERAFLIGWRLVS